ncbi:MAG: hypothetical protein PQJ47_07885 [Sphaerochaetaceae bacterium]|nr:hypothetical protein [Sphaerochaetaceae bacterium]
MMLFDRLKKDRRVLIVFALVLICTVSPLVAATNAGSVTLIGSDIPEVKVEAAYNVTIPMLEGDSMLTQNNNLKIKSLIGVSPVAATVTVDAVLTPIAVMELSLGGSIGTGWDFAPMGLEGLILNGTSDSLGGAYMKGKAGAALQFDTGAIWDGEWSSVQMRAYQELNFQAYTEASSTDVWEYELAGDMVNGYNYKGEYVVGYAMPLPVNFVALMLEHYVDNIFSTSTPDARFVLGLIANVDLPADLSLTIIPQIDIQDEVSYKRVVGMLKYSF